MAAALVRRTASSEGTLRVTNLARDLSQIAELVEICFGPGLDPNGRASVREMKAIGRLGPILWIVDLMEMFGLGLGRGFVWRVGGRVMGNVSIYSGGVHPWLGRGWLIANVAVHPTFQRRGIARKLMDAAMEMIHEKLRGKWVALEVEANNQPAQLLYESLGFETFETLDHWEVGPSGLIPGRVEEPARHWGVRPRRPDDAPAEIQLVFSRARTGGMAWTQLLSRMEVQGGFLAGLSEVVSAGQSRWVLPDPALPNGLLGSMWVEISGWRNSRVSLFLDPALSDSGARQALLRVALNLPELEGRVVRIETARDDPALEEILTHAGFRRVRSLTQMRYHFDR